MHVGILGGGQLARMMAIAGLPMGLDFTFLDPKGDACAAGLGRHLCAEWTNSDALARLAECDRVTCDFENVPAAALEMLAERVPVHPAAPALAAAQDRLPEKNLFREIGLDTPDFRTVSSRPELAEAVEAIGLPAVLKTRRLGYDGKGQAVLTGPEDLEPAWQHLGGRDLILEAWVDFDYECAITTVRSAGGEIRFYPLTRTLQRDGMLSLALAPIKPAARVREAAQAAARRLVERLGYVGCLSLELFVAGARILGNEFAPRVHNSAHWTIEGAACSQFENHLRAVCDLPLGATAARGAALMVNFIGELPEAAPLLAVEGLSWHDYRKQPRAGRKLGHATLVADGPDALRGPATQLSGRLDSARAADFEEILSPPAASS